MSDNFFVTTAVTVAVKDPDPPWCRDATHAVELKRLVTNRTPNHHSAKDL